MPANEQEYRFATLSAVIEEMAGMAAHAARGWLVESCKDVPGTLPDVDPALLEGARPLPEMVGLPLLASAKLGFRMELVRREQEIKFFVVKNELPISRPATMELALSLQPESIPAPGAEGIVGPQSPGPTHYQLALPWFVMRAAEIAGSAHYLPPSTNPGEALLIRLDPEQARVLAVVPEPRGRRCMRLSSPGSVKDHSNADRWDVHPFLAVIGALRAFQSAPSTSVASFALPEKKPARNDPQVMIDILATTCSRAVAAVAAERDPEDGGPRRGDKDFNDCRCGHTRETCPYLTALPRDPKTNNSLATALPATVVGDLTATLSLQLGKDGKLVNDPKAGVTLDLRIDVQPSGVGAAALLSLDPPRFVRTGAFREAILQGAARNAALADAFSAGTGRHEEWDGYFEGAREGAVVFRSSWPNESDQIEVLALSHRDRAVLAWLRVKEEEQPRLAVEIEEADIFHDSSRSPDAKLAAADAARFFTFFAQVQSWLSLL